MRRPVVALEPVSASVWPFASVSGGRPASSIGDVDLSRGICKYSNTDLQTHVERGLAVYAE